MHCIDIVLLQNLKSEAHIQIRKTLPKPVMTTYEARLGTFTYSPTPWPHASPTPQPTDLAAAGFIFVPDKIFPDMVECPRCLLKLDDWKHDDNAILKHIRRAPSCKAAIGAQEASNPTTLKQQDVGLSDHSLQLKSGRLLNRNDDSLIKRVKELKCREADTMKTSYEKRLATFTSWPHAFPQPTDLARAGFEFAPSLLCPDKVRCTECLQHRCDWQPGENPLLEHLSFSPHCKFAKKITDANKPEKPSIPQSFAKDNTKSTSRSTSMSKSKLAPQASTKIAADIIRQLQSDQISENHVKQQPKAQLHQPKSSKQDIKQKKSAQQIMAQDSKQEQTNKSASADTQTTPTPFSTISTSPEISSAAIAPTVTPAISAAVAAVAKTSTSNPPTTALPASYTPADQPSSEPSRDTKTKNALSKATDSTSKESPEKAMMDMDDWVDLGFQGDEKREEKDDWFLV